MDFRVGDVVEWHTAGKTGRVTGPCTNEGYWQVAWQGRHGPEYGPIPTHQSNFRLIRRPVRVGDVLIGKDGARLEAGSITVEALARYPAWLDGWAHRDGTPIDSASSGSDAECERCGISGPLERDRCPRCLPSKPANAPPRPARPADRFAKAVGHVSEEALAQALWLEDGEVERHIEERYDNHINGVCDPARTKAAQQRAWDRDDLGKRTHWTRVASAVLERLRGQR